MTIIEIRTCIKPDHYFFQCQPFNNFFRQIKVGRKTLAAGFQKKKKKTRFQKTRMAVNEQNKTRLKLITWHTPHINSFIWESRDMHM